MSASTEQSITTENRRFAVVDSMRGNGVKLNADPYDTSECPSALDLFVETLLLDQNYVYCVCSFTAVADTCYLGQD